jgi:hypothetical protein
VVNFNVTHMLPNEIIIMFNAPAQNKQREGKY